MTQIAIFDAVFPCQAHPNRQINPFIPHETAIHENLHQQDRREGGYKVGNQAWRAGNSEGWRLLGATNEQANH
jgi:hypothetical protein